MGQPQSVTLEVQRGFWSVISTALGVLVVTVCGMALVLFLGYKAFVWVWPTFVWLVPLCAYIAGSFWFFYRACTIPDALARSHRQYQVAVLIMSNVLIIIWFAVNSHLVGP